MTELDGAPNCRRLELKVFGLLAILLAPAIAIATVGGYGLSVWIYQLLVGPPSVSTKSTPVKQVVTPPK